MITSTQASMELLKHANFIKSDEKEYFVLLNDRHSTHRTLGGKAWHDSKIEERRGHSRCNVEKRVNRAIEIFTKSTGKKPVFIRKLDDDELSSTLDQFNANTSGSLYKVKNKDYIYVMATHKDIQNSIKSFRLKKTNAKSDTLSKHDTSTKNPPPLNQSVPSGESIVSLPVQDLAKFLALVQNGTLTSDDALKQISSRFSTSSYIQNQDKNIASIPSQHQMNDFKPPSTPSTPSFNGMEYGTGMKRASTFDTEQSSLGLPSSPEKKRLTLGHSQNDTMCTQRIETTSSYDQTWGPIIGSEDDTNFLKFLDDTSLFGANSLNPRDDDNEHETQPMSIIDQPQDKLPIQVCFDHNADMSLKPSTNTYDI